MPQGGVLSLLLTNIYLTEVDAMLERATMVTQEGPYTRVEYARYADDLVILVDWHRRHDWLFTAVHRRLREELANLDLRLNEDKSRIVDLRQGETFGFLGFGFRRVRSLRDVWRAQVTPKLRQRTALLGKLREVPTASLTTGASDDRRDHPDSSGVDELLPDRERETVLGVCKVVGRAESACGDI